MTTYPSPSPVSTVGPILRDGFAAADVDSSKWESGISDDGSISQSAGTLTVNSGTASNGTTFLLGRQTFSLPAKLSIGLQLSQRIANQQFFVELVSVNPATGLPDEEETAAFVFDGTTAAQAKYRVTTGGLTPNLSAASTFPGTATAAIFEIEVYYDRCWFHGSSSLDSFAARSNSYRLQRQSPDPTALYKLRLRWVNGSTAPASNTSAQVNYLSASEYQELSAEVIGARGTAAEGIGLAAIARQLGTWTVQPGNTPNTAPWLVTPRFGATGNSTSYNASTSAGTNATSVKASGGTLLTACANNATALKSPVH